MMSHEDPLVFQFGFYQVQYNQSRLTLLIMAQEWSACDFLLCGHENVIYFIMNNSFLARGSLESSCKLVNFL